MRLGLRAKLTMVMAGLVLLSTAVLSLVYAELLLQQELHDTDKRANELASEAFESARQALEDARSRGLRPASDDPQATHDYVVNAFDESESLQARLQTAADSPSIYEASIVDRDDVVLISSDHNLTGKTALRRPPLSQLVQSSFVLQVRILAESPHVYEVDFPFNLRGQPFGEVRIAVSTALLLNDVKPRLNRWGTIALLALGLSTLLAAVVSGVALSPIRDILAQLERISAGVYDTPVAVSKELAGSSDEFGQVRRKIQQVSQQLRGVHEIFSSLRDNMNSVMAGLEDGLLLFTKDARAVMISPAAEKFLGAPAAEFLGRRVTDIFPPGHPLFEALHLDGEQFTEIASETEVDTVEGRKRVGVSVQEIQGAGERMGAMVTLRDLDSLESINTQLQVSERLAAVGRITAGVAHEVKNPLNSMRLWLENLKESLPGDADGAALQAVHVLDTEIDRLDAVVKRFLDFSKPMDVRLEPTQLADLLRDVLEVAKPQLQKANVQVAQLLPIGIPEVFVDRDLLKQAVLNLVLNAVEAMPNGGQLQLTLSRRGEIAEITVGDTGKGILPENRQKVFQLFFTTRPGGSGIGLASTFRIVQLHNGSIDFTSEVGRGTTFRIELPLAA
ncbi:MAG TPA: ATP-binding protein [Candidatus Eisenbacteria bacterium]|nr:ATP-binding protein [Candidatus Eisenbacteria bacterium]